MNRNNEPILRIRSDPEYFTINKINLKKKKLHWKSLSISEIYDQWKKNSGENFNQTRFDFYLSCMVLMKADPYQRRVVERKTSKGARNIPFKLEGVFKYLNKAMKDATNIKISMLNSVFEAAFTKLKEDLGFSKKNPYEFCYEITDRILTKASPECKSYLERQRRTKFLFEEKFQEIKKDIEKKFSKEEDEDIIREIRRTKDRKHLSAIALSTEYGETYVLIVNPHNKQIKMEAWKFLKLLEDPETPKLLYDFEAFDTNKYNHKFIFNTRTDGRVEGAFFRENSTLRCTRFEQEKKKRGEQLQIRLKDPIGHANFMLDTDYILCLYTVLKKLKDDKIRFDELREKADIAVSNEDHFKRIAFIDM
ncbi:hypothetical protein KAJ27_25765 [bacterium]|nr:hypothetical protein [bacterium]